MAVLASGLAVSIGLPCFTHLITCSIIIIAGVLSPYFQDSMVLWLTFKARLNAIMSRYRSVVHASRNLYTIWSSRSLLKSSFATNGGLPRLTNNPGMVDIILYSKPDCILSIETAVHKINTPYQSLIIDKPKG